MHSDADKLLIKPYKNSMRAVIKASMQVVPLLHEQCFDGVDHFDN